MIIQPDIDVNSYFDNLITSFEVRVQKIQTAFQSSENFTESSHSLYDSVHSSLTSLRKERDLLNSELCETIAKNGSLRRKDYNTIMAGIISAHDEWEREAEIQFLAYIETQKETAQSLKNSLMGIKEITSPDATEKIAIIKEQLFQISKLQETRKETVMKTFIDFQQMHNRMMICLEHLLEKGDHIQIKDIKRVKDQIIREINPLFKMSKEVN